MVSEPPAPPANVLVMEGEDELRAEAETGADRETSELLLNEKAGEGVGVGTLCCDLAGVAVVLNTEEEEAVTEADTVGVAEYVEGIDTVRLPGREGLEDSDNKELEDFLPLAVTEWQALWVALGEKVAVRVNMRELCDVAVVGALAVKVGTDEML
jgi:hypothetical protein